jgi:hypothetical protein
MLNLISREEENGAPGVTSLYNQAELGLTRCHGGLASRVPWTVCRGPHGATLEDGGVCAWSETEWSHRTVNMNLGHSLHRSTFRHTEPSWV